MRIKGLAAGVILLLITAGCGHKAPPLPPEHLVPVGFEKVTPVVRDDVTLLVLKVSDRYVNRSAKVKGIRIEADRCDAECNHCQRVFDYAGRPGVVVVEDVPLEQDTCYRVKGETDRGAELPRYVVVVFKEETPPPVPLKLREVAEDRVTLGFGRCRGTVALFRREDRKDYPYLPLYMGDCRLPFTDRSVKEGHFYCYRARRVAVKRGVYYLSAPSSEVCVRPEDTTPPPVPKGLKGMLYGGTLYLYWDPVEAEDLAGYNVYMRKDGRWIRLNRLLLKSPAYTTKMRLPKPGAYFAVSSVDKKGNESKKSKPVLIQE